MQKFYDVKSPLLIDLSIDTTITITLDESSEDDIRLEFVNERLSTDYILIVIVPVPVPRRFKTVIFPANLDIDFSESSINVVFFHIEANCHIDKIIRSTI